MECEIWQGAMDRTGYGARKYKGRKIGAHVAAWIEANGPVPPRHDIAHLCGVRACVNPNHLRPMTRSDHMRFDGIGGQNRCIEHPGTGRCRECERKRRRNARAANRNRLVGLTG